MYQITEIDIHKGIETIFCTDIRNHAIAQTMARLASQEFNRNGIRYKYIVQEAPYEAYTDHLMKQQFIQTEINTNEG